MDTQGRKYRPSEKLKNHHYGQNIEPEVHGFNPITDNRIKAKRVFRSQVS